jgi:hypothetical protein
MIRLMAFCLFTTALLSGCMTVPKASPDDDARAKTFAVRPDKANIYLYRNEFTGHPFPFAVALDGKFAGETAMNTYFMWEVDPGLHEIVTQADEYVEKLKVNAEAGRNYFVWQEVKIGMTRPRPALQLVDDQTGRKGVSESARAQSHF